MKNETKYGKSWTRHGNSRFHFIYRYREIIAKTIANGLFGKISQIMNNKRKTSKIVSFHLLTMLEKLNRTFRFFVLGKLALYWRWFQYDGGNERYDLIKKTFNSHLFQFQTKYFQKLMEWTTESWIEVTWSRRYRMSDEKTPKTQIYSWLEKTLSIHLHFLVQCTEIEGLYWFSFINHECQN